MNASDDLERMIDETMKAMEPQFANDPEKAKFFREMMRQRFMAYAGQGNEKEAGLEQQETIVNPEKLRQIAIKDHPECMPLSERCEMLDFDNEYNEIEYKRISYGLESSSIDEKWIGILDNDTLRLWRSWSPNMCIYEIQFKKIGNRHRVEKALVDRDFVTQGAIDKDYSAKLLKYIIERMLLGHRAEFPYPEGVTDIMQRAMFRHGLVGSSLANDEQ